MPTNKILLWIDAVRQHWGSLVTGGALIGVLGIWQSTGHYVKPYIYWVLAIGCLLIASYKAWADEHEARTKAETHNKPALDIILEEVIVEPRWKCADCFVHVSVHNTAKDVVTNLCGCKLSLIIGGKLFSSDAPLSVQGFALGHWEADEEEPWKSHKCQDHEIASDDLLVKVENTLLEQGNRKEGWLRFVIQGVPKWPSFEEGTGRYYPKQDSETGEPDGWEEETTTILETTTIKAVRLEMRDAFGAWHSGQRDAPLCERSRTIMKVVV